MCIWMLIPIVIDQRYFVKVPRGSVSMLPSQRRCAQYFFEKKKQSNYLSKMMILSPESQSSGV